MISRKKLQYIVLLCVVSLFGHNQLQAQYSLLYSDDVGTPLSTQDINACQNLDSLNTARLIIASNAADNTSITLSLPTGVNYVAGSIATVSQMGGLSIAEADISDLSNPIFSVSPADLSLGNEIIFSWAREATCDAVNYQMAGGVFKDIIEVNGDAGSLLENNLSLNSYDVVVAALSILSHPAVATTIGSSENVDISITNGGQGCLEEFEFYIIDEPGMSTSNLQGTNAATVLSPTATNADTTFYTITSAFLSAEGLGNCFDNGEQLMLTRTADISTCETGSMYGVRWGCDNRMDCQIPFEAPGNFSIQIGVPNVRGTENIGNLNLWCQSSEDYQWTFTNVGSEPAPGTGGAYNVEVRVGWDWNSPWEPYHLGSTPWSNFSIGGNPITQVGSQYRFDLSDILPVGLDPDGPGGLEDLDGDGVFDDLAVGESFTIDFTIDFTPACRSDLECSGSRVNWRRPAWKALFDDQCESKEPTSDDAGPNIYWGKRQSPNQTGPTDMEDGDIATFEFSIAHYSTGIVHHNDDRTELRLMLPAGLNLAPTPNAMYEDAAGPILSVTQVGQEVVIVTQDAYRGTYAVDLQLDCAAVTSNQMTIDWEFWHLPNDGSGVCCPEKLDCSSLSFVAHCPLGPCPGIATVNFEADRNTFGFTDHTMTTPVTRATASELNIIYTEDKVLVTSDGIVNSDLDQIWIDIRYTNKENCNPFDFDNGSFDVYDASTGTTTNCPITAPAQVFSLGSNQFISRIDATHLIGSCLPAGFVFTTGDSLNLVAELKFNGCMHDGTRYEFPSFRAEHKGVAPGGIDTLSCDHYGTRITGLHPTFHTGGPAVRERSGCEIVNLDMAYAFIRSSHTDDFENEYRPHHRIDSSEVIIPDYYNYVPGSARYYYRIEGGSPTTLSIPDPIITPNGDGTSTFKIVNTGNLIPSDKNNNSSCCIAEYIRLDLRPSCETPAGRTTFTSVTDYTYNLWDLTGTITTTAENRDLVRHFDYTPPVLNLNPINQSIQTTTTEVEWEVEICNLTTGDEVDYNWLLLENVSQDISITNAEVQLFSSSGMPVGAPTNPTINAANCGGADTWIELESLEAGRCKNITIYGEYTGCTNDSLSISHGWDCLSYPTDPCAINCQIEDKLYVNTLPSEVQLLVNSEPVVPLPLCTQQNIEVQVSSAQAAYLDQPQLIIDMPTGSNIVGNITYEYPRGSGNVENAVFTQTANSYTIDLEAHSQVGSFGIPGTIDALTPQEREIVVQFSINTDCDFTSGSGILFQAMGNRPCGQPAINDGVRARTSDLSVLGVNQPFNASVQISMDDDPELIGCEGTDVEVNLELVGLNRNVTNTQDSVFVTLDEGVDFVAGSFSCCAANCLTLDNVQNLASGQTKLALAYSSSIDITTPQQVCFSYQISNSADADCGMLTNMLVEVVSAVSGVACPTAAGGVCPSLNIVAGQENIEFTPRKTTVSLLNSSFDCTDADQRLAFTAEFMLDDLELAAGEHLYVDLYCADAAGEADTFIGIEVVDGPIAIGQTFMISNSTNAASCDLSNGVVMQVSKTASNAQNNCLCDQVMLLSPALVCPLPCPPTRCGTINAVKN